MKGKESLKLGISRLEWKKENGLLFAAVMIFYVENPTDFTTKTLKLIHRVKQVCRIQNIFKNQFNCYRLAMNN